MRKFLETYPTVQFDELYKVYPDYGVMLSEIVDVGKKSREECLLKQRSSMNNY